MKKKIIIVLPLIAFFLANFYGHVHFNFNQLILILTKSINSIEFDKTENMFIQILFFIRLPRSLTVLLCGASLSVAGVLTQGLFKNSLASPCVLGASQGAVFGALLSFYCCSKWFYTSSISFVSCLGSVVATFVILIPIIVCRLHSTKSILLLGLAFSALISSLNSVLISLAMQDNNASVMIKWMMGGFYGTQWQHVLFCVTFMLPVIIISYFYSFKLDLMTFGDLTARSLGIKLSKTKITIIVLTSILVGSSVCVSGGLPFVGLVVPHVTRMVVGPKHKDLLFYSIFIGSGLLLFADILARNILSHREIELGIITAMIGAPFFIWLIFTKRAYS